MDLGAPRPHVRGGSGRHHHHPRRQRRRQDHDAPRRLRHGEDVGRGTVRRAANRWARDRGHRPARDRPRAGRTRNIRGPVGGENLRLGAYVRRDASGIAGDYERVYEYFPVLAQRRRQQAGTLSGGEQQMLAVARALMSRPRLLLLDEPSLGLAPLVVREIFRIVQTINKNEGVSVLLVEQNAAIALDLADHVYLLETGRVVMEGPASDLKQNDAVRRSYLGY